MNQVKETLFGFGIGIGIYAVLVELVGIFFSKDMAAYTLGLLFGVIIAVFLVLHMAKTLDKALDLPQKQATKYVKKQSFLRLFIMTLALITGLVVDQFNFIALALGIFGLKVGALTAPFFLKRLYADSYVTRELTEEEEGTDQGKPEAIDGTGASV